MVNFCILQIASKRYTMRQFLVVLLLLVLTQSTGAHAQVYGFGCSTLTHAEDLNQETKVEAAPADAPQDCGAAPKAGVPEPGSSADKDMTYEDLCLRGVEVQGARPQVCQVHRRMPAFKDGVSGLAYYPISPLNLNPWYMISMQDPVKPYHPYMGTLYRGGTNYAHQYTRLSQTDPVDTIAGCIPQIIPDTGGTNPYDPFWMRAEMDNCANQYILSRARYARFANEIRLDPANPSMGEKPLPVAANQADKLCQPMRLIPMKPGDQEYTPTDYIYNAWIKLLAKPSHLYRGGRAEVEPLYTGIGVKMQTDNPDNRIWPPTKGRTPFRCSNSAQQSFGKVCVNGIAEKQVERILDPSHPFSPRWDFRGNERDTYSPWTIVYTQNPLTILYYVRCAGNDAEKYYKVDIMPWRQKAFQRGIMRRILWNIICRYFYITYYELFRWDCWDGKVTIIGIVVTKGLPWNCAANQEGGDSGPNSDGQCCATNWGGKDVRFAQLFCGTGKKKILRLCKALAKSIPVINPLKIRSTADINFPLGVPEGYKFTDYFGYRRPFLRCWDTGKECGTGDPYDDPNLLSNFGGQIAIVGAGREGESCTFGGGRGEKSALTSVNFPGLYDSNWLNQIEAALGAFGSISTSISNIMNGVQNFNVDNFETTLNSSKSVLNDASQVYNSAIEYAEMGKRQDMAEPITSWSELKQYQMRATRDFGLNCIAKNEQVFKQGTGEDMILGLAGGQYQRLVPDDAGNGILSYTRYATMPWPMGWRGYVTDQAVSRRFPNFGSDLGGFDVSGKLTDLAAYIGLEATGNLDTGHKADGLHDGADKGLDNAMRGDILVYDEDVAMPGGKDNRQVGSASSWRLPYVAYVKETNLSASNKGGLDPVSELATKIAPGVKNQWVSVIAFNHGKFPDVCGNTDAWGDGQEYKMFKGALPTTRENETTAFKQSFAADAPVKPKYSTSCEDPRNSECVEELWNEVKRYSIREDHRGLSIAGGLQSGQELWDKYAGEKPTQSDAQTDTANGTGTQTGDGN
jgi:hypothetical protein